MDSGEVIRLINEFGNQSIIERSCPNCGMVTTFLLVHCCSKLEDESPYFGRDYHRCMKCLKLFREELIEVKG